jgi:EF hand domain-containing protein
MKRWIGLVLIAGTFLVGTVEQPTPAVAASAARSFGLGDLGGLGDLLGSGGLGSLGDLLGLGGDSDALGGILGDVLGGLGRRDDYGYSDRYDDEYDDRYRGEDRYRRPRYRRGDRDRVRDRLFGRLDLGANGFVERPELSRFARRSGRNMGRSQESFNRLDRNRDGRLSRSEFSRVFR